MAIEVDVIPAAARARYIKLGSRFNSEDTLAQADQTLDALDGQAAALTRYGFGTADVSKLTDARDGLLEAGVSRAVAAKDVKEQRSTRQDVLAQGKDARLTVRSVLAGARRALAESEELAAVAAISTLDVVLDKTSSWDGSPVELGNQLALMQQTLSDEVVAGAASERGGPQASDLLGSAIQDLRSMPAKAKRGTPQQTERLDIFDGMIVELCRAGYKAARLAARAAGTPAFSTPFELVHLRSPKKAQPSAPAAG